MDYEVIFSGGVREGHHAASVIQAFVARLHIRPEQAKALFSGRVHVLKRTASRDEATELVRRLARIGAVASVRTVGGESGPATGRAVAPAQPASAEGPLSPPDYTPFRGRWTYKPALFLVAGAGVAAALLYFALLITLLVANLFHAFSGGWMVAFIPVAPLAMLAHGAIALLGLLLLVVLAKPLLALTPEPEQGIALDPKHEPDLFLFLEDLCQRLDVAVPKEVRINNRAAVTVDYRRGVAAFFRGDLVLTLGLPLVTAYDARLLAACAAAQLAHFSRRGAPRCGYLLLAIYVWLHRAVHARDGVDRLLQSGQRATTGVIAKGARAATALFVVSQALSRWHLALWRGTAGRLIQRRVADADAAACRIAGCESFAEALRQSRLLALAETNTLPQLQRIWRQRGMLPDDIAMAIRRRAQHYSPQVTQQLRRMQEKRQVACRDILPSDGQRLADRSRHPAAGELTCRSPASVLFGNFAKLSHRMTVRFYRDRLKFTVTADRLLRTVSKDSEEDRAHRRIDHFFIQGYCEFARLGLRTPDVESPGLSESATRWRLAVDEILRGRSRYRLSYLAWEEAEHELIAASHQEVVQRAGLGARFERLGAGRRRVDAVHQACRDAEAAYDETLANHAALVRPFARRLSGALALLSNPAAVSRLPRAAMLVSEAQRLVDFLGRLETLQPDLHTLRVHAIVLEALLNEDQGRKNAKLRDRIAEQCDDIRRLLTGIGVVLKGVRHPDGRTAMNYALKEAMADDGSPLAAYDRGTDVAQRLILAQRIALARLIEIAQLAEVGFGLKGLGDRAA